MFYLSTSLRFCWLLFLTLSPILSLLLAPTPVRAEDNLAITFDLPPAQQTHESLVRYQESLPPISASEIAPPKREEMALRFAQNDVAMPVASHRQQDEMGTVAEALTRDHAAESLLAATPETHRTWLGSDKGVKSPQQRLAHSPKDEPALNAANVLETGILEDWIYEGGSDSLVARTVGSAEGTRRSDGRKTTAYYGHTDPGNGVWNLGTFSYQHEAVSPEEADEKQLKRLQHQELQLKEKAAQWNVPLSIEVRLNGLDLANQAPLAALDKGGYIERLAEAYKQGKSGEGAIVWARTQAYFDPERQDWDAPGLGNNPYSIQRDQERRMAAIDQAFRAYKDENMGQINGLNKLPIASASAAVKRPLLSQSKPIAAIDFSLKSASTAEQADVERSDRPVGFETKEFETGRFEEAIAPDPQMPTTDLLESSDLESSDLEANIPASNQIELDDSLIFEDDRVALDEWNTPAEAIAETEPPATPQHQRPGLPLSAPLSTEATSEAAIKTIPAEVAASTETANSPKVSLKKEKPEKAQKKALIRTEDSIVPPE